MRWRHWWPASTKGRLIALSVALEIIAIGIYGLYARANAQTPGASFIPADAAKHVNATNPIVAENLNAGVTGWGLDHPLGIESDIQGYVVPDSVNVGDSVQMYVSTTAPSYTFRIYRLGWYQGLGARLMYTSRPQHGIAQPAPLTDPATRMASASNWRDPVTVMIPAQWTSGLYIVKLVSSNGMMRYASFVVRDDASHSQILFVSSVTTYQAYNTWGGRSLYNDTAGDGASARAYAVSFDRPMSSGEGLGDLPSYEYDMLRWLERQGYDVSYAADTDVDLRGQILRNHRLVLFVGHDEYWSTEMRLQVVKALGVGVSLGFFGANDAYWHVRFQNSPFGPDRVVVCYKDATLDPVARSDPPATTVLWRDEPLAQPEETLLGAMWAGIVKGSAPLVLAPGATPFLKGTSLKPGSKFPGLEGANFGPTFQNEDSGEYDRVFSSVPLGRTILTASPLKALSGWNNGQDTANSTMYTAASGARVFDAGTFWWGLGLDDYRIDRTAPSGSFSSPDFQRFTANILAYLLGKP